MCTCHKHNLWFGWLHMQQNYDLQKLLKAAAKPSAQFTVLAACKDNAFVRQCYISRSTETGSTPLLLVLLILLLQDLLNMIRPVLEFVQGCREDATLLGMVQRVCGYLPTNDKLEFHLNWFR